jgi:hypothetical protein
MTKTLTALIGLLGMFFGAGLILPALAQVRDYGTMPSHSLGPYTLGIILALLGVGMVLFGLWKRKPANHGVSREPAV